MAYLIIITIISFPLRASNRTFSTKHNLSSLGTIGHRNRRFALESNIPNDVPASHHSNAAVNRQIDAKLPCLATIAISVRSSVKPRDGTEQYRAELGSVGERRGVQRD